MIYRSSRACAQRSSACRRGSGVTIPVGKWWDGADGVLQRSGNDPLPVHPGGNAAHAAGGVDQADLVIARFLHGIDLVPAQKLDQQIIQEIRPRAHQNILRAHLHPAKP